MTDELQKGLQRYGNGIPDYRAVPLYGDAYKSRKSLDANVKHVCDVSKDPLRALCGRPKSDSLMEDSFVWGDPATATCSTCLARWRNRAG